MRYTAKRNISFSIRVKGREDSVRISFTSLSTGGSTYSTTEERIIEALEKSPMYGTHYHRAPECVNENVRAKRAAKVAAKKQSTAVDSVANWQEAVEYLTENFDLSPVRLTTPENILREAELKGVTFPKLV